MLIRQLLTFLFLSLIAMLIGLLGFLPVLKRTLVPLFNIVHTVEQIDAGNLARRFPPHQGQREIDRLAESFNGMLERLEASFEAERETKKQMRRFIADASHELRTPLTSIHGFLEVLLRGAANQPDQLHKALKSMHGESERLNKLVHDLLLLAKLDRTPHVFNRFYRSDSSRTRKYGGAGLGLSITKSIVDIHRGTISVVSQEGAGCTFNIWLPK